MKRLWLLFFALVVLSSQLVTVVLLFQMKADYAGLREQHKQLQVSFDHVQQENTQLRATVDQLSQPPVLPLEQDTKRQEALKREVEEITGLKFKSDVPFRVMTQTELQVFLDEELSKDMSDEKFMLYQQVYQRLGLLPQGFDFKQSVQQLLTEQVAGLYDTEKKTMFVIEGQNKMTEAEKDIIIAHELTHALRDQYQPDLFTRMGDFADRGLDDVASAVKALAEGDATLVMVHYGLRHPFTLLDAGITSTARSFFGSSDVLNSSPPYLQKTLLFPYEEGLAFTQFFQLRSGFSRIEELFANPPLSTEQILHPEKYAKDIPQNIMIDVSGLPDWKTKISFSLGEFELRTWLEQFIPGEDAHRVAEGWDGGRVQLLERGQESLMVVAFVFDSDVDRQQFEEIFETLLVKRFPELILFENPDQVGENRYSSLFSSSDDPHSIIMLDLLSTTPQDLEKLASEITFESLDIGFNSLQ